MKNDKCFCLTSNYSVVVPYADFVKMIEIINNIDDYRAQISRVSSQLDSLYGLYSELLSKVAELD